MLDAEGGAGELQLHFSHFRHTESSRLSLIGRAGRVEFCSRHFRVLAGIANPHIVGGLLVGLFEFDLCQILIDLSLAVIDSRQ